MSEIVEAVTPQQILQVRDLFRQYRSELPPQLCFAGFEDELRGLPGDYRSPAGRLLLARVAGQPVGCVGMRPFPLEGVCEMKRLYVRPPFRGGNLGIALLNRVLLESQQAGYSRMRLDTHPPTMAAAVRLYKNMGFYEVPSDPATPVPELLYLELRVEPSPGGTKPFAT